MSADGSVTPKIARVWRRRGLAAKADNYAR